MPRKDAASAAVRITSAPSGREQDTAKRQRNYLIAMAVRVICFVSAVLFLHGWLMWVGVVAAIFLPYVAVVLANSEEQRADPYDVNGPQTKELPGSTPGALK